MVSFTSKGGAAPPCLAPMHSVGDFAPL